MRFTLSLQAFFSELGAGSVQAASEPNLFHMRSFQGTTWRHSKPTHSNQCRQPTEWFWMCQQSHQDTAGKRRQQSRNKGQHIFPEAHHIETNFPVIVDVHDKAVAKNERQCGTDGAANGPVPWTKQNAHGNIEGCHNDINERAETMHIFRTLDLYANVLDRRDCH